MRSDREGVYLDRFEFLFDVFDVGGISERFIVAEGNVGLADLSDRDAVDHKAVCPHAAAEEGKIVFQNLGKAVARTVQNAIVVRLFGRARGK